MNCPVCGRQGLPPDCAVCPQCDSDLTCFQVLDELSGARATEQAKPSTEGQSKGSRGLWLAAAVILVVAALLFFASKKGDLGELYRELTGEKERQNAAIEEKRVRSDSNIHIDAQIRIVNEPDKKTLGTETLSTEKKEQSDKSPVVAAAQHDTIEPPNVSAEPEQHKKQELVVEDTAAEATTPPQEVKPIEKTMLVANEYNTPPATEANKQPVSAVKAANESVTTAVRPAKLPVLKGSRKRRVRAAAIIPDQQSRAAPVLFRQSASAERKKQPPTFFFYQARDRETVWELAEHFYGNSKYYPVIMELNPHLLSGGIKSGSKVRLFADRRAAAALYRRKTEHRDGLLLWKYKVRPGETWQSIYARFFPPRYSGMVFYPGNQDVVPGKTVSIILR